MFLPWPFFKYEGLGNDFIVIATDDEHDLPPERVPPLCDRRLGVGADGVLLVTAAPSSELAARMRVINADGSRAEMCGNGVRCVALHIARLRGVRKGTVVVDTDSGPRVCMVDDGGGEGMVTVEMGVVRVLGEHTLDVHGTRLSVTTADAGNPHAVLLGAFAPGDVENLGPRIASHPAFPHGTNVGFASVSGEGIALTVWERGVGLTRACGTGACAAAAAACAKGLTRRSIPIDVRLPGGTLSVTIDEGGRASMRGPARRVFSGRIEIEA